MSTIRPNDPKIKLKEFPPLKAMIILDGYWVKDGAKTTLYNYGETQQFKLLTENCIGKTITINLIHDLLGTRDILMSKKVKIDADEVIVKFEITRKSFKNGGAYKRNLYCIVEYGGIGEIALVKHPQDKDDYLNVHMVRFIPEVMDVLKWGSANKAQLRWFDSTENNNPKSNYELSFISKAWMKTHNRVYNHIVEAKNRWNTHAAINSLRDQIYAMPIDFPSESNTITKFGFFDKKEVNKEGQKMPRIEKFYHINHNYDTDGPGGLLEELDDVFGTLANFNTRVAAKGTLTFLQNHKTKVTVEKIAVYIQDSFDFNGDQELGSWNFSEDKVSKIPNRVFARITNKHYREYREDYGFGSDFILYSEIFEFDIVHNNTFILEEIDTNISP